MTDANENVNRTSQNQDPIKSRHDLVLRSRTFTRIAQEYNLPVKRVLDLGCGYGEYMQRFGPNSVGVTTTSAEVAYGAEHNLDLRMGNVEFLDTVIETTERFDVFWANNLFEHLLAPHAFLVKMKEFATDDALLILGVPMVPKIESLTKLKKFRGSLASPHINFFTRKTFQLTVERAGWKVIDNRGFVTSSALLDHLAAPFMPHMYLVAQNDPSYRYPEKKIKEWKDDEHYDRLLAIMEGKREEGK